jgi:protein TonB
MTVIISVIIFVTAISLYEFFSERSWQRVSSTIRNEVVFENRNKNYGAYTLRKNYDKNMMFILFGLMISLGAAYGAFNLVNRYDKDSIIKPPTGETITPIETPPIEKDEIIPPTTPPTPPTPINPSTQFIPPIAENDIVEDSLPTQKELETTNAGEKTQIGNPNIFNITITDTEETPETIEIPNEEPTFLVDEEAEFPGGYPGIMKFIQENFVIPNSVLDEGIGGSVVLRFVVEKDGQVSNVSVIQSLSNECDKVAIKVVQRMQNWKPARINGRVVRAWYTIPINVTLN